MANWFGRTIMLRIARNSARFAQDLFAFAAAFISFL